MIGQLCFSRFVATNRQTGRISFVLFEVDTNQYRYQLSRPGLGLALFVVYSPVKRILIVKDPPVTKKQSIILALTGHYSLRGGIVCNP